MKDNLKKKWKMTLKKWEKMEDDLKKKEDEYKKIGRRPEKKDNLKKFL
jgi:hypothetical protein